MVRLLACVFVVGALACGGSDPPKPQSPAPAASAAPALEPGKGIVASPACSDVKAGVRVDIEESDTPGLLMVKATNTGADPLHMSGASKRAAAGYGSVEQGEHISFQMKAGDNWYVV